MTLCMPGTLTELNHCHWKLTVILCQVSSIDSLGSCRYLVLCRGHLCYVLFIHDEEEFCTSKNEDKIDLISPGQMGIPSSPHCVNSSGLSHSSGKCSVP